ncbi:hypothetical protein MMC20_006517 [Loxospora ochrophaea]|nr:hypothetical protein [Loxospora ochrophaea]
MADNGNANSAPSDALDVSGSHNSDEPPRITSTGPNSSNSMQPTGDSSRSVEMTDLSTDSSTARSPPSNPEDHSTPEENRGFNAEPQSGLVVSETQAQEPVPSSQPEKPPSPLTREMTTPAIGPPLEKPSPPAKESESTGASLTITLLLNTGARHPYKIDDKYLKKRNVNVTDNNPTNMSVYTLKELIWREWREEWEPRPSSPSSIRLIHFGKLLDDKSHLKDGKFALGDTPHVVHMTIKPQEIVDEEDARIAKSGARDRDGVERSPRCRPCIIM